MRAPNIEVTGFHKLFVENEIGAQVDAFTFEVPTASTPFSRVAGVGLAYHHVEFHPVLSIGGFLPRSGARIIVKRLQECTLANVCPRPCL